jgi:hypothetical protein
MTSMSKFKIGDRVRRIEINNGRTGMQIGDVCVVVQLDPHRTRTEGDGVYVDHKGKHEFNYEKFLELVEEEKPRFKVGDRVRRTKDGTKGTSFAKLRVGDMGTVTSVTHSGQPQVKWDKLSASECCSPILNTIEVVTEEKAMTRFEIGKKYKFPSGNNTYTPEYINSDGVLARWKHEESGNGGYTFINHSAYSQYVEVKEPRTLPKMYIPILKDKNGKPYYGTLHSKKDSYQYLELIDWIEVEWKEKV